MNKASDKENLMQAIEERLGQGQDVRAVLTWDPEDLKNA